MPALRAFFYGETMKFDSKDGDVYRLIFGFAINMWFWPMLVYEVATRPLSDFLGYPKYFALFFSVTMFSSMRSNSSLDAMLSSASLGGKFFRLVGSFVLFPIFLGLMMYLIGISVIDSYNYLVNGIDHLYYKTGGIAIFTLLLGLLFFWFRVNYRFYYGLSEILCGMVIASYKGFPLLVGSMNVNPDFLFAMLTAGVYLVVRGCDNVQQSMKN